MKQYFKRFPIEYFFEAASLTNHKNIGYKYFDVVRNKGIYMYQYGFIPVGCWQKKYQKISPPLKFFLTTVPKKSYHFTQKKIVSLRP